MGPTIRTRFWANSKGGCTKMGILKGFGRLGGLIRCVSFGRLGGLEEF